MHCYRFVVKLPRFNLKCQADVVAPDSAKAEKMIEEKMEAVLKRFTGAEVLRKDFWTGAEVTSTELTDYKVLHFAWDHLYARRFKNIGGLRAQIIEQTAHTKDHVCADCGCEQSVASIATAKCTACGGLRVVLISLVERLAGPDWRDSFDKGEPNGSGTDSSIRP